MCSSAISGMTGYFVQANKIGKINLAATGKDLMEDEKQGDVTIDLFTSLDMESEAVAEHYTELENNQILGLLCGFLSVDDWYINSSSFYFQHPGCFSVTIGVSILLPQFGVSEQ